MSGLQDVKAKWRARVERSKKAVPVEIAGVGTVHVRAISVSDNDFLERVRSAGDAAGQGAIIAGLLCYEDGRRLDEADFEEMAAILSEVPNEDQHALVAAAVRGVNGDEPGN